MPKIRVKAFPLLLLWIGVGCIAGALLSLWLSFNPHAGVYGGAASGLLLWLLCELLITKVLYPVPKEKPRDG